MADHPIAPTRFTRYIGSPVQSDIIPIIPAGATLSAESGLTPGHLGKIPGRYNTQTGEWVGWHNWPSNRATEEQLRRWEGWQATTSPIALGVILGEIIAIDCDCDDKAYNI